MRFTPENHSRAVRDHAVQVVHCAHATSSKFVHKVGSKSRLWALASQLLSADSAVYPHRTSHQNCTHVSASSCPEPTHEKTSLIAAQLISFSIHAHPVRWTDPLSSDICSCTRVLGYCIPDHSSPSPSPRPSISAPKKKKPIMVHPHPEKPRQVAKSPSPQE